MTGNQPSAQGRQPAVHNSKDGSRPRKCENSKISETNETELQFSLSIVLKSLCLSHLRCSSGDKGSWIYHCPCRSRVFIQPGPYYDLGLFVFHLYKILQFGRAGLSYSSFLYFNPKRAPSPTLVPLQPRRTASTSASPGASRRHALRYKSAAACRYMLLSFASRL